MSLPGQLYNMPAATDIVTFAGTVCLDCSHVRYCSILFRINVYGNAPEVREIDERAACLRKEPLPVIDRGVSTRSGIENILPCPFCGHPDPYWDSVIIDEVEEHFLCCSQCGGEGPYSQDRDEASARWQTRAQIPR